jgi:5-methylcytosine-specific restriction endonuclease McrA
MNCPKCGKPFGQGLQPLQTGEVQHTLHHVIPLRFRTGDDIKISICRKCHDELEKRIPTKQQMPRSFYFLVVNNFLEYEAVKDEYEICTSNR